MKSSNRKHQHPGSKLALDRTTLRSLSADELGAAGGGSHPTTITITTLLLATCAKAPKKQA